MLGDEPREVIGEQRSESPSAVQLRCEDGIMSKTKQVPNRSIAQSYLHVRKAFWVFVCKRSLV